MPRPTHGREGVETSPERVEPLKRVIVTLVILGRRSYRFVVILGRRSYSFVVILGRCSYSFVVILGRRSYSIVVLSLRSDKLGRREIRLRRRTLMARPVFHSFISPVG